MDRKISWYHNRRRETSIEFIIRAQRACDISSQRVFPVSIYISFHKYLFQLMFLHHYNCIINVFTAQKSLSLDFHVDPLLRVAPRGFLIRENHHYGSFFFFRARSITGGVYALLTRISNITACCSQGGLNGRVVLTARVTLLFSFRPIHERKRAPGCAHVRGMKREKPLAN